MELKEQICDVCRKMQQLGQMTTNDGNMSARLDDGTFLATPTGISKSFITPEKLVRIDGRGEMLESLPGYRPSSKVKMHLRCYKERKDVNSVLHAHPPVATRYAIANVPLSEYSVIETVAALGSTPVTSYETPSTYEVPNNMASHLGGYSAMLLRYHGALIVGADMITAYYRVETLEFFAKISLNARMLGGVREISRENTSHLISVKKGYGVTDRHSGYKKYSKQGGNRC